MAHLSAALLRALLLVAVLWPSGTAGMQALGAPHSLDLAARASCQAAIEAVYWRHRTWPTDNPNPKPPLDAVLPRAAIETRVEDSLRQAEALAVYWHAPLTGAALQAELERMAAATQQPETLKELFAALDHDPVLAAECLARPLLASRLLRNWYAADERLHGEQHARATGALARLQAGAPLAALTASGAVYREVEFRRDDAHGAHPPDTVLLAPQEWDAWLAETGKQFDAAGSALPAGRRTALQELAAGFVVREVLAQEPGRLRLAVAEWPKRAFEDWWAEARDSFPAATAAIVYDYRLPSIDAVTTPPDTWSRTLAPPDPRYWHSAVWTGSEMIIWGGTNDANAYGDGGRYSPATDTWAPIAPSGDGHARWFHQAVWTGTEMIVWGGAHHISDGGGRYNPTTNTWQPVAISGAPGDRLKFTAVWTGEEMLVWGGADAYSGAPINTGGRYNPATNTWQPVTTAGAPSPRYLHTAVWADGPAGEMIVWGGYTGSNFAPGGARYSPQANTWQPVNANSGLTPRYWHTAAWTGSLASGGTGEMLIWGGIDINWGSGTGARYNPIADTWLPITTTNAPAGRWLHNAVWTGTEWILWGGEQLLQPRFNTGGRYNPATDTWTPTATTNAPEGRSYHTAVWTGAEMIVWGGFSDDRHLNTGGRYHAATDSWLPVTTLNTPSARFLHAALWTGAEMIVWGGFPQTEQGGRYYPATDTWAATSLIGAPVGRQRPTAVWTGSQAIFWGGFPDANDGGRYDPTTDTWTPTAVAGAPSPRYGHTAVWTGSRMIVWGGYWTGTGGLYDPSTDSWTPTSVSGAPSPRDNHGAVWSGTVMVVWGGDDGQATATGGRYDPATDIWQPTALAGAPVARAREFVEVWTGDPGTGGTGEMIVWGGCLQYGCTDATATGGRYNPISDTWLPTQMAGAPEARPSYGAWTGTELFVWGGLTGDSTGGRYNPATNSWVPTSLVNAPPWRWNFTVVWTGADAIVWGGFPDTAYGWRYHLGATPALEPRQYLPALWRQ